MGNLANAGVVGAYLDAASAAVTEWGGKVANKLGDRLIALFGYPVAQENDLQRAAHAASMIQRSLAELNRKNVRNGNLMLAVRIAIDSGPMVIDAAGEIFGELPKVAARAQAVAQMVATTSSMDDDKFRSYRDRDPRRAADLARGITRSSG